MKTVIVVVSLVCAIACTKSSGVDAPASDGVAVADAGDADRVPAAAVADAGVAMASRPQLPTTIEPQAANSAPSYVVKGCASGTRSAAPQNDGDDIKESVSISANAAGVTVAHKVPHACCLKGSVETKVEGGIVTVRELLQGKPCRCMCGSGIETNVPLAPGTYEVKLILEVPGAKPREVASQLESVKGQ